MIQKICNQCNLSEKRHQFELRSEQNSKLSWNKGKLNDRSEFVDSSSFGKEGRECTSNSSYIHVDILVYICVNILIFGT